MPLVMRAVVVAFVLLAGGCRPPLPPGFHRTSARSNGATGAGMALGGIAAVLFVASAFVPHESGGAAVGPTPPVGRAAVVALGVLASIPAVPLLAYGLTRSRVEIDRSDAPSANGTVTLAPVADDEARKQAIQLTVEAAAAARDGECAVVATLRERIRSLDREVHSAVFARHIAIHACLVSMPR